MWYKDQERVCFFRSDPETGSGLDVRVGVGTSREGMWPIVRMEGYWTGAGVGKVVGGMFYTMGLGLGAYRCGNMKM
jgi:hypothetical protein